MPRASMPGLHRFACTHSGRINNIHIVAVARAPTCWENVNIFHLTQNIILLTIIWIVSLLGVKIFIKFVSVA